MNRISALVEGNAESSAGYVSIEKMIIYEAGGHGLSPDKVRQHLDLGRPASRTMRTECLLFKPPRLWYFCYSSPN